MEGIVSELPESIQSIVDQVGLPSAMELVRKYGGTSITIPRGLSSTGHEALRRYEKALGVPTVKQLSLYGGGEPMYIPKCEHALRQLRNEEIFSRFEQQVKDGAVATEAIFRLAREHKLTDRSVWKIIREKRRAKLNDNSDYNQLKKAFSSDGDRQ